MNDAKGGMFCSCVGRASCAPGKTEVIRIEIPGYDMCFMRNQMTNSEQQWQALTHRKLLCYRYCADPMCLGVVKLRSHEHFLLTDRKAES